jgi:signal transduction histidine kinase
MALKFYCFFGMLMWAGSLGAQLSPIDSLWRVIQTTRVDSTRARSLCRLCEEFRLKGSYSEALYKGQDGLGMARRRGDSTSAAICLNKLANVYFSQRDYVRSSVYYAQGLRSATAVNDREEQAQSLLGLGNIKNNQGAYAEADSLYRLSLLHSQATGNRTRQARCLANLGILAHRQGRNSDALRYLNQSLDLRKPLGDQVGMALVLFNIASVYQTQGQAVNALTSMHRALDLLQGKSHATLELALLVNLAQLHQSIGDSEQTEAYDRRAEALAQQLNDRRLMASLWINRANRRLNSHPPNLDEAAQWISRSLALAEGMQDQSLILQSLLARSRWLTLGEDYSRLDSVNEQALQLARQINDQARLGVCLSNLAYRALQQGQPERARQLAYDALGIAQTHGDLEHRYQCALLCYQCDSAAGRWADALAALRLHISYGDSLKNNQQSKQIGWLQARREHEQELVQRDLAISRLEADRLRRDLVLQAQRSRILRDSLLHTEELALQESHRQRLAHDLETEQAHRLRDSLLSANRFEVLERERLESEVDLRQQRWLLGTATGVVFFLVLVALLLQRSRSRERKANDQLRRLYLELSLQKAEIEAQSSEILSQRDQLEATNRQLQALNHSREELVNMIVHDLKNPLNAILGLAALPPDAQRLTVIRSSGQQMSHLVSNILDVQRYQHVGITLNSTDVLAETLVYEAIHQVDYLAQQKNIQISVRTDRTLMVNADVEILVRVLVNLLTNAIKFSPIGDTLDLEVRTENKQAVFSLTDHGKGIAQDSLKRIFEKYERSTDPVANSLLPGTGLGLAFCKLAVEAHGGSIGAVSEPGQQTTFYFSIPLGEIEPQLVPSRYSESPSDRSLNPEMAMAPFEQVLRQLGRLNSYEITAILDLLDQLPNEPQSLRVWKERLESLAFAGDDSGYHCLIEETLAQLHPTE